jgi:hypothetical protein
MQKARVAALLNVALRPHHIRGLLTLLLLPAAVA